MEFKVETEQEEDGRWIAEITDLPGAMKYGESREQAISQVEALALRVMADRIEQGEHPTEPIEITSRLHEPMAKQQGKKDSCCFNEKRLGN